jgi:NDP-sugar pyrophosphorylase family protein
MIFAMARILILAGGVGSRMAPYSAVLPKPLMPLGQSTIIEYLLDSLLEQGFCDITISIGHLGYLIRAVVDSRYGENNTIQFLEEKDPLGTAGPLGLLEHVSDQEYVVVINGDTLTNFHYIDAIKHAIETRSEALIVCKRRQHPVDFGVIEVSKDGLLESIIEKPTLEYLVSTGINLVTGLAIRNSLKTGRVDMPDFLQEIKLAGMHVACLEMDAIWYDLGRPDDLVQANTLGFNLHKAE